MPISPFDALISFARWVKRAFVRVVNFVMPIHRNAKSYARLLLFLPETAVLGCWQASLADKNGGAPDTLVFSHSASNKPGDRERFLAQLANEISNKPETGDLDLLLVASDTQPITPYTAVARMFGRRLNMQIFASPRALADARNTILHNKCATDAKDSDQIQLSERAAGCLRPPLVAKNMAREYLKTIDPTGRYCAISFPPGKMLKEANLTLATLPKRYPGWRVVILNDPHSVDGLPPDLPPEVLLPARIGFDFLTLLCLAIEADAYIGAADVYGLVAYLARRPASLLAGTNPPVMVSAARHVPPIAEIERLAVDLFGANVPA